MKKRCYIFTIVLFLLLSVFPCNILNASTKQESINTSVKKFMKYSKDFNLKGIRSYVVSLGNFKGTYNLSKNETRELQKYFKKCGKKMTYKIISKSQKKNTATVKLMIKYVDSYEFTENFYYRLITDSLTGKADTDKMNSKQLNEYLNSVVRTSASAVSKTKYKTQTIKLTFVKKDHKWKIKKMTKDLDNIIEANFPKSLKAIEKSFYQ